MPEWNRDEMPRHNTRRSSAACTEGTAQRASARLRGRGTSFRTPAVMMPSVPSAPTKSWRRQYPVLSLRKRRRPFQMLPSGKTTSSPST